MDTTNSAGWLQMRRQLVPEKVLNPQASEIRRLGLILLVALLHGAAYLFLVPPWQHYDEPNHFEYVWLAAQGGLDQLPGPRDFDPGLSYRVIESMHRYGFYAGQTLPPRPSPTDEKLRLSGYPQLDEPPLYYLLAGLPLRLFPGLSLEGQLYAARAVSLLLYLLTVLAGWGAAREITWLGHLLRWVAPALLALLPGLAELMSAVNNDALAIAAFSLFFWGCLRLLQRGLHLLDLLWVLAAAALAWFSKGTAALALGLLPLVVLLALLRGRVRALGWALLGVGAAVLLWRALALDDAAAWYRAVAQPAGLRQSVDGSAQGAYALALDPAAAVIPDWSPPVYQLVPPAVAQPLLGQTVTLGVWMWAERAGEARSPRLVAYSGEFSTTVALTKTPQFFAFQVALPPGGDRLWVELDPRAPQARTVYYDGLVLALGGYPLDKRPVFTDDRLQSGVWGEQPFENLLRNPSFETPGLRLRAWLDNRLAHWLPDNARPSQVLASMLDPAGSGYFYRRVAPFLFQTFWARFAWGHVALISPWGYAIPLLITGVAALGLLVGAVRAGRELPWEVVFIAALALALAWLMTLVRGAVYLPMPYYYLPPARLAYPVIVPAALALSAGWLELPGRWPIGRTLLVILLLALDLLGLVSVAVFYGRIVLPPL